MLKRLVLLFLLVVMPLQMAWAVPSVSYCQHEQGAAAKHIGHHAHQHQDGGKFKGKIPGGVDDDCAYCHLGGVILPPALHPIFAALLPSINSSSFLEVMSSVPAREPERPKWTLAA
ncbi:MAG: hypothetical protein V4500_05425 [Pseudomonadota bacterium]